MRGLALIEHGRAVHGVRHELLTCRPRAEIPHAVSESPGSPIPGGHRQLPGSQFTSAAPLVEFCQQ